MHEIEYQAHHDQLTGCLSRSWFEEKLLQRVKLADENNEEVSLLYLDLDGFKNINDTLGHDTGDAVLVQVAKKLFQIIGDDSTTARLGGDEFAILAPAGMTRQQTLALGQSIADCMSTPQDCRNMSVKVQASVGIARYPDDADTAESLLSCADIAMYQAKATSPGQVREYDAEFGSTYKRRLALKSRIENALNNDQFELHYQPKVCTTTRQVIGAEALIRWNEPEFAAISPAEWIPLAEETGDIHRIGEWVTQESLRYLQELENQGIQIKLSINISATQFDAANFPQVALDLLQESGVKGSSIEFEITETAVIADTKVAVDKLNQIRACGVSIAIDDFGVKYSSLAYLGDLPIDVLKIDRIFVQRMDNGSGRSMIQPIVVLAKSLDLETVVEGIETEEQLQKVISLGCDCIQGYYYSKPVPGHELPAVIAEINTFLATTQTRNAA